MAIFHCLIRCYSHAVNRENKWINFIKIFVSINAWTMRVSRMLSFVLLSEYVLVQMTGLLSCYSKPSCENCKPTYILALNDTVHSSNSSNTAWITTRIKYQIHIQLLQNCKLDLSNIHLTTFTLYTLYCDQCSVFILYLLVCTCTHVCIWHCMFQVNYVAAKAKYSFAFMEKWVFSALAP